MPAFMNRYWESPARVGTAGLVVHIETLPLEGRLALASVLV